MQLSNETSERKLDHIEICLNENIESRNKTTGFEDIDLVHQAAPEINLEEVSIKSSLFGKELNAPIIICPMTGGHKRGKKINLALAKAAQELNIGFGVGSQRAGIEDSKLEETYQVRELAPDILLLGNLGATQLNQGYGIEEAEKAIEMIDADALGFHFNPLQEAIQIDGDINFKEIISKISKIASKLKTPVYAKETGGGITGSIASKLVKAGVKAIDVSGVGGTSWAGVESMRKKSKKCLGNALWDWGIPTSISTAETARSVNVSVISSGGIRTGIDAVKAIALGADIVGIGLPLLRAANEGTDQVIRWLEKFIEELRVSMFLAGCKNLEELQKSSLIITGKTKEYFNSREIDSKIYLR